MPWFGQLNHFQFVFISFILDVYDRFFYIQGGKEYLMRAQFKLPSVQSEELEAKPPIEVKFEIPYFTTSGIQVKTKIYFLYFS